MTPTAFALALRIARRELRGGVSGFRILIACLALGVAAIAAVGSVRSAIEAGLAREGAAMLGGDAEISLTYRFATLQERGWMADHATTTSEVAEFRSMVQPQGGTDRALTQVKAVDGAYPLVGKVTLSPAMPLAQALKGADGLPGAIMAPALIDRLALKPGDAVTLGGVPFRLMAALTYEPDANASGFSLGPRTLVARSALEGTALLAPGTLFDSRYRMALPPGSDLEALKQAAQKAFPDSGLRWRDARDGAPGISNFVERLSAFLILVGLSGLAVGGVGVSSAVRGYLAVKIPVIATLRTLGASRAVIFLSYLIQIGVLSAFGILLGLCLGAALPLLAAPVLTALLPIPADFTIYPGALAQAALYGALTALLFTLWPLSRAAEIRAAALFRDAGTSARTLPPWPMLLITLALLALLVGSAALFSGAAELTLWTAAANLAALVVLALAALGIRALARRLRPLVRGRPPLRWAVAAISAPRNEALPVVLSLGLGLTVLASVGQIDGNMRAAISRDLPERAPSDYVVDIQKDQIDGFLARAQGDPGVSRVDSAPMLRGVITRINGRPAQEVAPDSWVLRGDRGVSYADTPPTGTRVTGGTWWPKGYDGPPQISFSAKEGAEMGLKLGDTMTVNILGRDITGTLTSFRDVDFRNAGMGFILLMDAHALSGAPHSWIASVYATPEAEAPLLRDLGRDFPNITAISVRDAIDRVSALLRTIAAATSYGAAATLLTGFLVLIGAALSGEAARMHEAAVLKTLGASRAMILRSLALRAALLGAAAGAVALLAGIAGGWAVCHFVFDTGYEVIWPNALLVVGGGLAVNLLAGLALAWRPLSARPARVLRSRD
ncbi:FtsX-like permease family protein [Pseudooceanicola sp. CBS1P-1]|uniref:FtsX-like permease family protein n=1 Tax=Pseudooceanicola albus TaxID=2692189 RepID=A0A6L7G4C4_9RHOB|nr:MULTISPECIES: FtsX-like permease family protein [Pseudooceanicola]MBT9384676.1 FtsX-like permease family protein [Pseudooceanicola endophyticus]MXN18377.1 FtsX-like permease family protein [Pseudooceanicola albus]